VIASALKYRYSHPLDSERPAYSADGDSQVGGQFFRELSSNTNPKRAPRLLHRLLEATIRALGLMGELKYVTDQELIDKYKAEASRKAWFGNSEWVFTPTSIRTSSFCFRTTACRISTAG
jgi:hypothetical protein